MPEVDHKFFLMFFDVSCSAKLKESVAKEQVFQTGFFLLDTAGNLETAKTGK